MDTVIGYPSPFNPDKAVGKKFKIINMPKDCTVDIYNIAGEKAVSLSEADFGNTGVVEWDGKNTKGEDVLRGIYPYVIKSADGKKKIGKIALIR